MQNRRMIYSLCKGFGQCSAERSPNNLSCNWKRWGELIALYKLDLLPFKCTKQLVNGTILPHECYPFMSKQSLHSSDLKELAFKLLLIMTGMEIPNNLYFHSAWF